MVKLDIDNLDWDRPYFVFSDNINKTKKLLQMYIAYRNQEGKNFTKHEETYIKIFPLAVFAPLSLWRDEILVAEQTLIMSVTAFETYCSEKLKEILEKRPDLINKFCKKKDKTINDIIGYYKFQRLDHFKNVFEKILDIKLFQDNNEENKLKLIFQDRHILVHKGGKIDKIYIKNTNGNTMDIGTNRVIEMKYAEESVEFIESLIEKLEKNSNSLFNLPESPYYFKTIILNENKSNDISDK